MKLRLTNFLCYNDSTFDLGDSGLTLISGASGCGKTSLLRAILFVLFGDGTKVQSYGKTSCSVELEFEDMKIVRTKRPNRLLLNDIYEDQAAQEIINKRFGDTFKTSGYIQQNNLSSFILMSPTDKLEFLETFAFKDVDLGKIKGRCKAHIQKLNDELSETIGELNMAKEFLKNMEPPKKVVFPIKCGKTQYEKAEKNENIKHKNCMTLIKRSIDEKTKKESELNDLKILEATLSSRKEQLESIEVKLSEIQEKRNTIIYKGDYILEKLEKNLVSLISQRELVVMEEQCKSDSIKLEKMREEEIQDFQEELTKINETLWKEFPKTDIEEQKNEIKSIITDLEKASRLYKDIEENYVDEEELVVNKEKLLKLTVNLEQNQELYRKLLAQKEVYKCPACFVSLRLIEEKLSLSDQELDVEANESNIETLSNTINQTKRDITKLQRYISDKENKLSIFSKCKNNLEEILSGYEDLPSPDELFDEINTMREELDKLVHYENIQLQNEKRKNVLEKNIKNEILSKTYESFRFSLENLEKKITIYKEKIQCETIELNEEDVRSEISKEKESRNSLLRMEKEEQTLNKEKESCLSIFENAEKKYLDKYNKKHDKNFLETEIENHKNEIYQLELKKIEHSNNLQIIEEWKKYIESVMKYESFEKKVKELELKEKEDRSRYSAAMTLKDKILEAESIAISNIIDSINLHARQYLDDFFQVNPICVSLQAFKQNKKQVEKPCVNMEILYKEMECDIQSLSGGETSRLVLAYTLALSEMFSTPLIMLDEPTSSLDQDLSVEVFESIKENFGKNKLVLIIAHQVIMGVADKVLNLNQ
jgi:DNA repair exonuclease SbcCD ATPase subunit